MTHHYFVLEKLKVLLAGTQAFWNAQGASMDKRPTSGVMYPRPRINKYFYGAQGAFTEWRSGGSTGAQGACSGFRWFNRCFRN